MADYPLAEEAAAPAGRVAMPRPPRIHAPGATVHVVVRCNNREFFLNSPEDFERVLASIKRMIRKYEVTLYAYTLMSNHVHLLLQAPMEFPLGRPMRWFMTESAKAFHRVLERRGHFWERRYRACLIDGDAYVLAALRYLDRNPVRAGLVEDPMAYPWSSCAAYAGGTPNTLVELHPAYLALSAVPAVRQLHYATLLAPSPDPRRDTRDPTWTMHRAVGSPAFVARYETRRSARPQKPRLP